MHFEILVEGQIELTTLSILMEKIVGPFNNPHTWKIHKHRGIGKFPNDPSLPVNRNDFTLLHNLPAKLRAYGREMRENDSVVVLVDLDARESCHQFKKELVKILDSCPIKPNTLFRIAIEEIEAWFFGDMTALRSAYPNIKSAVLKTYDQDSQCNTWEKMADAIHPGGMGALKSLGKRSPRVLETKLSWAKKIAPKMDVEHNQSPSFQCFRDGLRRFCQ